MTHSLANFSFDNLTGVLASEASALGYRPGSDLPKSLYIYSHHTGKTVHFTSTGHNGAGWTYIPTNAKKNNVVELIIFND